MKESSEKEGKNSFAAVRNMHTLLSLNLSQIFLICPSSNHSQKELFLIINNFGGAFISLAPIYAYDQNSI
jgi:hypothetical protein